uniref:Uncharacterized protein n=1 Tax=Picea sitchensis TaxID=3332 RepID=D5AAF2_PICSI|nr:unknown [Picea sitchensis]
MDNATPAPHPAVSAGPIGLGAAANPAALLKRPRTPPNAPLGDYQSADSDHIRKRARTIGQSGDEVSYPGPNLPQGLYSQDDLPKTVQRTLHHGSPVMNMDFHPLQQTILLVGTHVGEIGVWEVGSQERLAHRNFKVWDLGSCSAPMQTTGSSSQGSCCSGQSCCVESRWFFVWQNCAPKQQHRAALVRCLQPPPESALSFLHQFQRPQRQGHQFYLRCYGSGEHSNFSTVAIMHQKSV